MDTPSPSTLHARALVLGGGGSTGNAWLIGVVVGLCGAGLDTTAADVTVGTSAGSTAAAQLACGSPAELYAGTLVPPPPATTAPPRPAPVVGPVRPAVDHLERTNRIIAESEDAADMRRRMGAAALELAADAGDAWSKQWRATVASRLPSPHWPERAVLLTAIDAATGDPVVFDRHSGVDLVDAVAASCSSVMPHRIGDRHFLDGGYRRNENADLAAGCERALVLSPFGGRTRHPLDWGMQLAAQVDELEASGSQVETVFPTKDADHLFGANAMDLSLRPRAARAGHEHGLALAERLGELWR